MKTVERTVNVEASPEVAFKIYVEEIDQWWPWQGAQFRYTFAGPDREPDHILFEAQEDGRFYEIFADGTTYDIGRVIAYEPPDRLVYTWQDPDWAGATTIEVMFAAQGEGTLVTLRHWGFEEAGVLDIADGYGMGHEEIMGIYAAFVRDH